MMRRLLLMRHGTAEGRPAGRDLDRELTPAGRAEAKHVGAWLQANHLRPHHVVCSTAPRAHETARIVCKELGLPGPSRTEPALYGIDPAAFLRWLPSLPRVACVLVVGHNPAMEAVAAHLSGDDDLEQRRFAPASLAILDLPDDWSDLGARSASPWRIVSPDEIA